MIKNLNLNSVFRDKALDLLHSREQSKLIHGTSNIRAAGNHLEEAFRDFLKSLLPPRYYVTHGHLIDELGNTSPQLDVIIADQFNLPALITSNDGTQYVPANSTLVVGELKSTYNHAKGDFLDFSKKISSIYDTLSRPLIENTAYELSGQTEFHHAVIGSGNRYLNHLLSFFFCFNSGDFQIKKLEDVLVTKTPEHLPNVAVFLHGDNSGVISYAQQTTKGVGFNKYPIEVKTQDFRWCYMRGHEIANGSREGAHLAHLYSVIFDHLAGSHLERANIYGYFNELTQRGFSKSSMQWIDPKC